MSIERRSSKRLSCDFQSTFRDFDSVTSWASCFASIKDISSSGLKIRTHALVRLSDRLGISFKLPGRPDPVEAKAVPAWISEIRNTEIYDVGVRFIEISEEDRSAVENFCSATAS